MSLRRFLACLLAASALAAAGCDTCQQACSHQASCAKKLGLGTVDVEECTTRCHKDTTCSNPDEVNSCIAGTKCETSMGYLGEMITCSSECKT